METQATVQPGAELELVVLGDPDLTSFVAEALAFEPLRVRRADAATDAATARVLVVDFDRAPPIDELRALRAAGWRGVVVAIGEVAPELRAALDVRFELRAALTSRELKRAVRSALAG